MCAIKLLENFLDAISGDSLAPPARDRCDSIAVLGVIGGSNVFCQISAFICNISLRKWKLHRNSKEFIFIRSSFCETGAAGGSELVCQISYSRGAHKKWQDAPVHISAASTRRRGPTILIKLSSCCEMTRRRYSDWADPR